MFHRSHSRAIHRGRRPFSVPRLATALAITLAMAWPAGGDWLVTQYGDRIETREPWRIDAEWVYFTDTDGREDLLPLEDVDLEASEHASTMITLYLTSWCGYCRAARELLEELDADFVEKDIENDDVALQEHRALTDGRGGVPVLKAGNTTVSGFSPELIKTLVSRQKSWQTRRRQQ